MSDNTNVTTESTTRGYLKCPQCRRDGKKCEVGDQRRHWYAGALRFTKCRRCTRLGHRCGPRVRATPSGQRVLATRQALNNASGAPNDEPQGQRGIVVLREELPLDGMYRNRAALSIVDCLTVQKLLFRRQCELTPVSRRLPHDHTLLQQRSMVKFFNSKLNLLGQSAIRDWRNCFNTQERGGSSLTLLEFQNLQLRFEVGQWRCSWIDANWQTPADASDLLSTSMQDPPLLSNEPEFVTCTKQMMHCIDPATLQPVESHTVNDSIDASKYLTAQGQLQDIFEPLLVGDVERVQQAFRPESEKAGCEFRSVYFPAAHIAFWNGDKAAALELTIQGKDLYLPENIFGENLMHLIAKAGDSRLLEKLLQINAERVALECITKGIHSALLIATIMDDCSMFSSMIGNCIGVSEWTQSLLNFAITARSQNVLELILQRRDIFVPPYTEAVRTAIQSGAEEIVRQIIPLLLPYGTPFSDIESLTEQAEQAGLAVIAYELRCLQPPSETWISDHAFSDLRQWGALLSNETMTFMASGLNGTHSFDLDSQYYNNDPRSSQYGELGHQYG